MFLVEMERERMDGLGFVGTYLSGCCVCCALTIVPARALTLPGCRCFSALASQHTRSLFAVTDKDLVGC